jgi:hypothetical protein
MLVLMNMAKMFLAYGTDAITCSSLGLNWSWFLRVLIPGNPPLGCSVTGVGVLAARRASCSARGRRVASGSLFLVVSSSEGDAGAQTGSHAAAGGRKSAPSLIFSLSEVISLQAYGPLMHLCTVETHGAER